MKKWAALLFTEFIFQIFYEESYNFDVFTFHKLFVFLNANAGILNLRHLSLFLCTRALPKSHKRLGVDNSALEIRKGST